MTTDTAAPADHAQPTLKPGATVQPLEGALRIPIGLITPSPLNPRKRWNATKVAEMSADMRINAQIQPIRVRPNPVHTASNGRPPYEIVVGETRWRAAPAAGLTTLDAVVRDCSDQELIKLALAENTKRQDLHPLEEADGYDALLRKPDGLQGYDSVQALAAAVGVSPSYVYQRLKLRALCAAGRDAFLAGTIDASVALLIARMPSQEEQARATARIVAGWGGEAYSFRQAAEFLQKEFMLRLSLARFDITAAYKVAGPCASCPKRSGAEPDLFADVTSGDMCQDARCYQAKAEEAHQLLLQACRDAGRIVLQGSSARAIIPSAGATPVGHYRLDMPCPDLTDSQRALREVLGQGFAQQIVVVDLPESAPVELVTIAAAKQALKARGLLRSQTTKAAPAKPAASSAPAPAPTGKVHWPMPDTVPAGAPASSGAATPGGEGAGGEKARRLTEDQRLRQEAVRVQERFGALLFAELMDRTAKVDELPLLALRLIVNDLFRDMSFEACEAIYRARGWDRGAWEAIPIVDSDARTANCSGRELGELLVALLVAEDLTVKCSPGELMDDETPAWHLATELGVDMQRVWQAACAEVEGAGSAAGSARRELDATATFIAQHGAAAGSATTTEAPSRRETYVDPDWKFPGTTEAGSGLIDQSDEGASHADH